MCMWVRVSFTSFASNYICEFDVFYLCVCWMLPHHQERTVIEMSLFNLNNIRLLFQSSLVILSAGHATAFLQSLFYLRRGFCVESTKE